ncbi:MAG: SRPBCC domain-containing protein [Propionibacteriaceae bacterium]|nr:SRPBCC domain-containing protein [Propionibacteriaceae bacterium]
MSEQSRNETPEPSPEGVVVTRTIAQPLKKVWGVLMTKKGSETLLGRGAMLGEKGQAWKAADGRSGVIRSFHPLEQVRFWWRKDDDAPASLVDLKVTAPDDDHTELTVTHTRLAEGVDPAYLQGRWEVALERIESDCF